ncbi:MAG: hypothetical protein MR809_06685 [Rikenellaceae bacterium]|nr:hypothetical protein [Rikenellaceae bacterium]
MKKTRLLSLLALSAVLAGCAEKLVEPDVKPEEKPGEEQVVEQQTITVSLPDDSEVESKVSIDAEAVEGKLVLNWQKDDKVTIIGKTTETYTLSKGEGTKDAEFTGNKVEPTDDGKLTLIYPAVTSDEYDKISYEGQTQTGNNTISHIRFYAKAVSTTTCFAIDEVKMNGAIKFYMKLPPEIGNPTEIIVNSPTPIFYAKNAASAGMVDQMSLKLENVVLEDRILTAYMMTAPQTVNIDANAFLKITVLGDSYPEMKYVKNIKPGAVSLPSGKVNVFQINDKNWASYKLDGEGTEASPYLINSLEELQMMRASLVHGKTLYYKLVNSIDMTRVENWEPLNWEDPYDCGIVFDGNGQTLSNLKSTDKTYAGFAGVLYGELHHVTFDNAQISNNHNCGVIGGFIGTGGKPGYVHDIIVKNSTVSLTPTSEGNSYDNIACGGLASNAKEARIETCDVQIDVINSSTSSNFRNATGGIVGKTLESKNILKNLTFRGKVKSNTEKYTGGILGWQVNSGVNIENCTVDATITSEAERVGGIVGHFEGGTISDCIVKGTVEQKSAVWNTGGIAGIVGQTSKIINCTVEASVSSSGDAVGGILGQSENDVTITKCSVSGNVTGHSQSGGVVGQCSNEGKNIQIERCQFSGTLSAADNIGIGGIVGYLPKGTKDIQPCVKNCAFTGTISGKGQRVGGIVGELAAWGQIYNCISTGNITGWQVVGGICGRAAGEGWNNDTDVFNIVEKCLVWGGTITAIREDTDGGSSAVVVGYTSRRNQLTDCFRSNKVVFKVSWPNVSPYDQENSRNEENYYLNCNEIPGKTFNFPYHGKVSAGKASDKARDLKWEETVWDLSKDVPALILK